MYRQNVNFILYRQDGFNRRLGINWITKSLISKMLCDLFIIDLNQVSDLCLSDSFEII